MSDGAWSKILEGKQRRVRRLTDFTDCLQTRRIERAADPGGKSDVVDSRFVRKPRSWIKHRTSQGLACQPRFPQAFSVFLEGPLGVVMVRHRLLPLGNAQTFPLSGGEASAGAI